MFLILSMLTGYLVFFLSPCIFLFFSRLLLPSLLAFSVYMHNFFLNDFHLFCYFILLYLPLFYSACFTFYIHNISQLFLQHQAFFKNYTSHCPYLFKSPIFLSILQLSINLQISSLPICASSTLGKTSTHCISCW